MRSTPRVFAILPAAGLSRRMGEPKLTLPFGGSTVIQHVMAGLAVAAVDSIVVVTRSVDVETTRLVVASGGEVIQPPTDPKDMRESVEFGLRHVLETKEPNDSDVWLLCPADCVGVGQSITQGLLNHWAALESETRQIVVPVHEGRRGHPTLFAWPLAEKLFRMHRNVGVNSLLRVPDVRVAEHQVDTKGVTEDVDTPEEYNAAVERLTQSRYEE